MAWILVILAAAAALLAMLGGSPLHVLFAFALACGSLFIAWLSERFAAKGRAQPISAALFGVVANMVGAGLNLPLLFLPYGSSYDSFRHWGLEWTFFALVALVGIALAGRGLVRGRRLWKLLGLVGLLLSLMPIYTYHLVYLRVVEARGLIDLW